VKNPWESVYAARLFARDDLTARVVKLGSAAGFGAGSPNVVGQRTTGTALPRVAPGAEAVTTSVTTAKAVPMRTIRAALMGGS
jgi:hypothetical protein